MRPRREAKDARFHWDFKSSEALAVNENNKPDYAAFPTNRVFKKGGITLTKTGLIAYRHKWG